MQTNDDISKAISLCEASRYFPMRNGRRVHYSTIHRWMTRGVKGNRLESFKVGGVRYTTLEAIRRFTQAKLSCTNSFIPQDREIALALDAEGV